MNEVTTNGLDTSNVISQPLKPSTSGRAQCEDNSFYDLMGSTSNMFPDYQSIPSQKNQQAAEDSTKIQYDKDSNKFCQNVNAILSCLLVNLLSHANQTFSALKGYGEQYLIPQDDQQVQSDFLNVKKDTNTDLTENPPVIQFDISKLFAGLSAEGAESETEESLLNGLIAQISSISSQKQSDMVFQNTTGNSSKADFIQTFSLTKEPDASVFHYIQATGDGNESIPTDAKSNLFVIHPKIAKSTSDCDVKSLLSESSIKSTQTEIVFLSETSAQGGQTKNTNYDQPGKTLEIIDNHAGVLSSPENVTNQDSAKIVHPATETPETNQLFRDTPIITKRDGTAIEVSLEPDGIGKLNIHLSLDRGLVNARIGVSETVGKELIENNMHSIVNALHNEGINIGSFSVHLKDKRKEFKDEGKNMKVFYVTNENKHLPINLMNNRIVSIFV
jgi:flagellar hook-length control protein FliK